MDASYSKNNLGLASSRHLLQHKDDPVAWQPWREDVLDYAREQGKPILLSIGYSACHWSQLMAGESFADPETARLMNQHFINIKVDREERPDLDGVYQLAHQLLTGRPGGWPLTVFLCPNSRLPFLAGTYFPRHAANGQIAFRDLLIRISEYYQSRGEDFVQTLDRVQESYEALAERQRALDQDAKLSDIPIERAVQDLLKNADEEHGGFGGAPKFPMPVYLDRLLIAAITADKSQQAAHHHLHKSLRTLARFGICDQVGGGFFRYATDARWMIPHFEKMLCDNALLLAVYAQSCRVFGDPLLEDAARGIARWALQAMRTEDGAFYGSLDADTVDGEGSYYLWTSEELKQTLDVRENALISSLFSLEKLPNFRGRWHLHRDREWSEIVAELQLEESDAQALWVLGREKLRTARAQRLSPATDGKVLTASNALMIRGLAIAARVFGDREYLTAAQTAMDFIQDRLWVNQRLYASWQGGRAQLRGYLDDYVFTMDALLELLQIEWRDRDYRFLGLLAEAVINNFEDREHGGFYFTAHDADELIFRNKPLHDSVLPSGNGIAAKVFGRLGHLVGEPRYLDRARRTLLTAWASMLRQPSEHHSLLQALGEHLQPPPHVLLKGDARMDEWRHVIQQQYGERAFCYWVPDDSQVHPPELFLLDENQGAICIPDGALPPQAHLSQLVGQLAAVLEGREIVASES